MKTTTPTQLIRQQAQQLRMRAEAASESAQALTDLVLLHRRDLLSDATIVHEIATLLKHAVQNLEQSSSER